jgi:oxygen-dependent protoporphyrinogen oxidase
VARRVVVVGGGISGLAAAQAAVDTAVAAGERLEVLVLEREPAVGGKAQTRLGHGWLFEGGPAGYLDDPATHDTMERLIDAAGLREQRIEATDAVRHRFVVRGGRAREVRPNPLRLVTGGILTVGGAARLLAEPFVRPKSSDEDESVFDFAMRRIGRQAAERLVAPMMLGIFAGDAHKLSLLGGFPRLAALEREHGSLTRGMLARRHSGGGGPAGPSATLASFREGMQSLPLALARRGGFTTRTATVVEALERGETGDWRLRVSGNGESVRADAVVIAVEAWSAARLLAPHAPSASTLLAALTYPPVLAVSLGFSAAEVRKFPRGFGCLVPRDESLRSLGCVWDSALFPDRAPTGAVLVRVLLGGAVDPSVAELSDADAVAVATDDLRRLFGVRETPVRTHLARWPRAIPQYEVGHPARVRAIDEEIGRLPGLHLAGNALHGIAFSKAAAEGARRGKDAARDALERTGQARSAIASA